MRTQAKEIMSKNPLKVVVGTSIEDALRVLVNHRITGLPVVDKNDRMVGVLSEYDILLQVAKAKKSKRNIFSQPIQYSKKVFAIPETTPLEKIMDIFVKTKFRRLPIVDSSKKLVGIVTRRDLMRVFYYRAKLEAVDEVTL